MKIKYIAIFLVLLCCFMGATSAAEDISTDVVSDSVDDAVTVDAVQEEISDSSTIDETTEPTISDYTTIEEINDNINTDENSEESAIADSEQNRAIPITASDWNELKMYCEDGTSYHITLDGSSYNIGEEINFANSATIVGTSTSYITGGSSNIIPFQSDGDKYITFSNVNFRDIDARILLQLATTGTNKFINCNFDNIHTYDYHSSVIWNNLGFMNISGCNFTNCNDGFGVISNYVDSGTVTMNVENCRFENNSARVEPGAINNCGNLTVTNSTFIHNIAAWWAGAIHTHTDAYTRIVDSTFTDNVAGWNGGALYSYSILEVINSTFTGNNCSTDNGGGAIGGYSYDSIYNITIDSCTFTNNANLDPNGYGGAIGVVNEGNLTVKNTTFVNNSATNGQAISAITRNITYCINCTNCNCTNCPNCTNCTHVHSKIKPDAYIFNNTFINHNGTGDTVVINGNAFIFRQNIFINSTQNEQYDGIGNVYGLTGDNLDYVPPARANSRLGSSILGDKENHDVIYVNTSSENAANDVNVDGQSWENAFGSGSVPAFGWALAKINEGGTIYVDGVVSYAGTKSLNLTIIGFNRENVIFNASEWNQFSSHMSSDIYYLVTYINITIESPIVHLGNDKSFINCTFVGSAIDTNENINKLTDVDIHATRSSYINFTNCRFIDYDIEGSSLLNAYRYSQVNFFNCTFENITAKSIVNNTKGWTLQDGINFYDCTFTDVNVKGIVDVPTNTNPVERYRIEGCTGVESFDTVTEDGRDFVNTTQSRTETVLVTDIDGEGNLLINLTDKDGNALAEYEVLISINGGEPVPYALDENGTLSIALSDLTEATGKIDITVSFEEDDDYKGASESINAVLVVNTVTEVINNTIIEYVNKTLESTSIAASALTATAKVSKTLSVTLKDASGKAIANKVITYSINGVTKTAKTNANGIIKISVNQAKAGTYYYSLCFLGDDDYKSVFKSVKVTVNKQSTKAVFKAKTFKVKAKTKKVSFTLKDAKGKAIKGKKITVKVNGKTYTAKTNAKGVATVSLKLTKKGKYTATAKFAGDTTYKAITKKAKITLK